MISNTILAVWSNITTTSATVANMICPARFLKKFAKGKEMSKLRLRLPKNNSRKAHRSKKMVVVPLIKMTSLSNFIHRWKMTIWLGNFMSIFLSKSWNLMEKSKIKVSWASQQEHVRMCERTSDIAFSLGSKKYLKVTIILKKAKNYWN